MSIEQIDEVTHTLNLQVELGVDIGEGRFIIWEGDESGYYHLADGTVEDGSITINANRLGDEALVKTLVKMAGAGGGFWVKGE